MYEITLRGGPFDGLTITRRECHVGLRLLVSGGSARGMECELYRVRMGCDRRFAANVDRNGTEPWQQVLVRSGG